MNVHNLRKLRFIQIVEDDDVIHAIQEFGPEMRLQLGVDIVCALGLA